MMLPGQHGVDGDVLGRQLHCCGAQESELCGLAGTVVRPPGVAGDRPGDRRRDDDPAVPAGGQCRQRRLHDVHGALEVDPDHLLDVLGREVFDASRREDACVRADDVQPAVSFHRRVDHATAVVGARHVGDEPAHLAGLVGQGSDGGVDVALVAARDDDVDARSGERLGDAPADALASAGDDGRAALQ